MNITTTDDRMTDGQTGSRHLPPAGTRIGDRKPAAASPGPAPRPKTPQLDIGPERRDIPVDSGLPARRRRLMADEPVRSTDPIMILNVQSFLQDRLSRPSSAPELLEDWNRFYASYDRIIRRFAAACGMQDCDIDECCQEVWVAVVNGLASFEHDPSRAKFRSWLYGIVRNKSADLIRSRMKHLAVSLNDSSRTFDIEDQASPPLQNLDAAWRSELLREALSIIQEKVRPRDFEIFVDRSVRKKSAAEVAAAHGMPEGAVRVVDHRLRKQLQDTIHLLTDGQMVASFS